MSRSSSKWLIPGLFVLAPIITLLLLLGLENTWWKTPEIVGVIDNNNGEIALESFAIHLVDRDDTLTVAYPDSSGVFKIKPTQFKERFGPIFGDRCEHFTISLISNGRILSSINSNICGGDLHTGKLPPIQLVYFGVYVDRISTNQRQLLRQYFNTLTTAEWDRFQAESRESAVTGE